jgi:hypothetical protein
MGGTTGSEYGTTGTTGSEYGTTGTGMGTTGSEYETTGTGMGTTGGMTTGGMTSGTTMGTGQVIDSETFTKTEVRTLSVVPAKRRARPCACSNTSCRTGF